MWIPVFHSHYRIHYIHGSGEFFEIFCFMRCTEDICISTIGFFHTEFVSMTVSNKPLAHFFASTKFIRECSIEPRFVDFEFWIYQQTIAIKPFDIVPFVGAPISPNIHTIFHHRPNQLSSCHSTSKGSRIKVGFTGGSDMEGSALDS